MLLLHQFHHFLIDGSLGLHGTGQGGISTQILVRHGFTDYGKGLDIKMRNRNYFNNNNMQKGIALATCMAIVMGLPFHSFFLQEKYSGFFFKITVGMV